MVTCLDSEIQIREVWVANLCHQRPQLTWPEGVKALTFLDQGAQLAQRSSQRGKNLLVSKCHSVYRGTKVNSLMIDLRLGSSSSE